MKHIVKESSPEAQAFEAWKQTWELTKQDLINNSQLQEQKKIIWENFLARINKTLNCLYYRSKVLFVVIANNQ